MKLNLLFGGLFGFLVLIACESKEAVQPENVPTDINTVQKEQTDDYSCPDEEINVAIILTDGVYNTEVTAPMDIFHQTKHRCDKAIKVYTVAPHDFVVHTSEKLHIIPDFAYYSDSLPEFDVMVLPTSEHHTDANLENDSLMRMITEIGTKAKWVMALCDGAFPLVKSGLVDGKNMAAPRSDQGALEKMFPEVTTVHHDCSFVVDGNIITSEGGVNSFAPALFLVEEFFGKATAVETAKRMAMDWDLEKANYKKF